MSKEVTSPRVASIAARYLRTGEATPEEIRAVMASALTQAENKPAKADEISVEPGDTPPDQ